jgi:hypothetical protein
MQVLLVHGIGRTTLSLHRLERDLHRNGHEVHRLGYVAAFESFAGIVGRVRNRLDVLALTGKPYAAIGHSFGGLLLRAALGQPPAMTRAPAHLIMLGTPNRPPRLAQRHHRRWPKRWIYGDCGQRLADPAFLNAIPPPAAPYTIIAGTRGRYGRFSPFGSEPNDGVVALAETLILDTDIPLALPAWHTFLMNNGRVRHAIRSLLAGTRE